MKPLFLVSLAAIAGLFSATAFSAPGEYWEVTSKMEMPGMPMAIPPTTSKVCISRNDEKDPGKLMRSKNSSDCKLTDIKTSGNKTTWKIKCNSDEISGGSGEMTRSANSYKGVMHLSGQNGEMTQTYDGKRVGGNCDTEAREEVATAGGGYGQAGAAYMQSLANMQNMAMQQAMCDTDNYTASQWINNADRFLRGADNCPGNKKVQLCLSVRNEAPHSADVYPLLVETEKTNGNMITKSCKLDMASITRTVCKGISDGNFNPDDVDKLSAYCPAEAKKYMEAQRSGRSYTSDNSGPGVDDVTNPAENAIDTANKLKGILGR
jgi:hypothetical protein